MKIALRNCLSIVPGQAEMQGCYSCLPCATSQDKRDEGTRAKLLEGTEGRKQL